jgi:drug/metabolite transporter (DMT)-like permease
MKNTFLYVIAVLIWGTNWFAIEFQLGEVAIEISLIYRFGLAAIIILVFSKLKGLTINFSVKQHISIAFLGLFNFSVNYAALYEAQNYLSSAMASIGFSSLLLFNIANTRIFFGKRIPLKTYFGALVGIAGIITLFWPEILKHQQDGGSLKGIILVLGGTLCASFGNMISVKNSKNNFPILQTSGWAMLYGTAFLIGYALYNQIEFTINTSPDYLISLFYLSVFGTVIAFYSYFLLLKDIGPEKASYSIVLFPVVAVIVSSVFEGFVWTSYTISGFLLVATGNLLVLTPKKILHKIFGLTPVFVKTESCTTK